MKTTVLISMRESAADLRLFKSHMQKREFLMLRLIQSWYYGGRLVKAVGLLPEGYLFKSGLNVFFSLIIIEELICFIMVS